MVTRGYKDYFRNQKLCMEIETRKSSLRLTMNNKLLSYYRRQLALASTICNHMIANTTTPQFMVIMDKNKYGFKNSF